MRERLIIILHQNLTGEQGKFDDFISNRMLDKFLKSVGEKCTFIILGIFLCNTIYYWIEDIKPLSYLLLFMTAFHVFYYFVVYRLEYKSIKSIILVHICFMSIILYPICVVFWQNGQITALLWYLLMPISALLFLSIRDMIYVSVYALILICSVFFVAGLYDFSVVLTDRQIVIMNIMTIMLVPGYMIYLLYNFARKNHIMQLMREEKIISNPDGTVSESDGVSDVEKYRDIFGAILNYIEKEKPYCNPNYTVLELATAVDSNIAYVAKAIKLNRGVNFNVFINTYRVAMVKEMLDKDWHNKYTMKYIYASSGFRHQSTFNKAFKEIEGVTPSDYVKYHKTIGYSDTTNIAD